MQESDLQLSTRHSGVSNNTKTEYYVNKIYGEIGGRWRWEQEEKRDDKWSQQNRVESFEFPSILSISFIISFAIPKSMMLMLLLLLLLGIVGSHSPHHSYNFCDILSPQQMAAQVRKKQRRTNLPFIHTHMINNTVPLPQLHRVLYYFTAFCLNGRTFLFSFSITFLCSRAHL